MHKKDNKYTPNLKFHFYTSIVKSVCRLGGSVASILVLALGGTEDAVITLAVAYGVAEVLGVIEEIV